MSTPSSDNEMANPGSKPSAPAPSTAAAGDYQDGWREETFAGFKGQWQPMPWYLRTLSSWLDALDMAGFRLTGLQEPQHPQSPVPQSLLLMAEQRGSLLLSHALPDTAAPA